METHVIHDESIGDLIKGVLHDLRALIREELALARVEIREQAMRARSAALSLVTAGLALAFAATFMLVAAAMGTADLLEWPVWAGFLTVAVVLGVIGLVTYAAGRKHLKSLHAVPEETISTLKENSEWIAKRLSSVQR
jgi:hypothetical protein